MAIITISRGTFSGGNIGTVKNSIGDTVIYNGNVTYTTVLTSITTLVAVLLLFGVSYQ